MSGSATPSGNQEGKPSRGPVGIIRSLFKLYAGPRAVPDNVPAGISKRAVLGGKRRSAIFRRGR